MLGDHYAKDLHPKILIQREKAGEVCRNYAPFWFFRATLLPPSAHAPTEHLAVVFRSQMKRRQRQRHCFIHNHTRSTVRETERENNTEKFSLSLVHDNFGEF